MSPPNALGEVGDRDHLVARDQAEVHGDADVREALLLLRVHAEVVRTAATSIGGSA